MLQGENEPREEVGEEILVIDRERGHRFRDVWAKVGYRERSRTKRRGDSWIKVYRVCIVFFEEKASPLEKRFAPNLVAIVVLLGRLCLCEKLEQLW